METNTLFGGIFGAFIVSCSAMVLLPNAQIGNLTPETPEWDGSQVNVPAHYPTEQGHIGRAVYVANGCIYCHTQEVRDPQYGPDLERGWGVRRTVARDYLFEDVPLLGSSRIGPDSTTRPAYITFTRSHRPAITPRSWLIQITAVPRSRVRRFTRSMICAWIVTSSAVVASSAISRRGLHESAMAIITRWRMPPENWCG